MIGAFYLIIGEEDYIHCYCIHMWSKSRSVWMLVVQNTALTSRQRAPTAVTIVFFCSKKKRYICMKDYSSLFTLSRRIQALLLQKLLIWRRRLQPHIQLSEVCKTRSLLYCSVRHIFQNQVTVDESIALKMQNRNTTRLYLPVNWYNIASIRHFSWGSHFEERDLQQANRLRSLSFRPWSM